MNADHTDFTCLVRPKRWPGGHVIIWEKGQSVRQHIGGEMFAVLTVFNLFRAQGLGVKSALGSCSTKIVMAY